MSFANRPTIEVSRVKLDADEIALAMRVPVRTVFENLTDGRAVHPWALQWTSSVYSLPIDQLNRERTTAAVRGDLGALGSSFVTVRVLSHGTIRFQRNKFIGTGRDCSPQDLVDSINLWDRCVVVSVGAFPVISFYPLDAKLLLTEALAGRLTRAGISARDFVGWVAERLQIVNRDVAI